MVATLNRLTSIKRPSVIIVGAGTAGSVICSKLMSAYDITVFDKSVNKKIPLFYRIPLLIGLLFTSENKYIKKRAIESCSGRLVPFFESNILGGASVMNGCVHVLGINSKWHKFLQKFNLDLKDMKKAYIKNFSKKNERKKISLRLSRQANIDKAFQDALGRMGIKRGETDLMNEEICGPVVNTAKRFFRSSVMDLTPFRKSRVVLGKKVSNLIVNSSNKVIGVLADGQEHFADHVILTAGVIGTNELLMRPGVRATDQRKINLNLSVGQGVKDHANIRINVKSTGNVESLNVINRSILKKMWIFIKHIFGLKTLMIGTGATSSVNLDMDGDGIIDTRINLLNFSENGRLGNDGKYLDDMLRGFSFSLSSINPVSSGYIEFSGPDNCNVRPNYMQHKDDEKMMNKAIDLCLSLLRRAPLSNYVMSIEDEQKIKNDREEFIRENLYSGYHLIGGCHDVVDENFQVNGFGNLYVCDASIFDQYLSSNIHSSVVIMAELFANKFLGNGK